MKKSPAQLRSETLRLLRNYRGIGIAKICKALGVGRTSYYYMERSGHIDIDTAHKLAKILNVPQWVIFDGIDIEGMWTKKKT